MSWLGGRPSKPGGPFSERLEIRLPEGYKQKLKKKVGDEKDVADWLRRLLNDVLSAGCDLTAVDYWHIADYKLKQDLPQLHAIFPAAYPRLPLPNFMYYPAET